MFFPVTALLLIVFNVGSVQCFNATWVMDIDEEQRDTMLMAAAAGLTVVVCDFLLRL